MAKHLLGKPIIAQMTTADTERCLRLKASGVEPTLAVVRVGERADDLSYERTLKKRCETVGIKVRSVVLPLSTTQEEVLTTIETLNQDGQVHGILVFRPLPIDCDQEAIRNAVAAQKDVDGCTDRSLLGVFVNETLGFSPCTAEAVITLLDGYEIALEGKSVAVVGRSLVVGRPLSMLLTHRNATVTLCHSRTKDLAAKTKEADIVVLCSGQMEHFGKAYFSPNQVLVDVGVNWNEAKGKICGDLCFDEVEELVEAATPVPGGVGGVTTAVLVSHVLDAAERTLEKE